MVALTATRSPEGTAAVPLSSGSPPKPSAQQAQSSGLFGGLARSLTIRPRSNSKRQNSQRRPTGARAAEAGADGSRNSNEVKISGEASRANASTGADLARTVTPVAFVPTSFSDSTPPRGSSSRSRRITLQSTDSADADAAAASHTLVTSPSESNMSRPKRQPSTSRAVSGRATERLEWGEPPRNANAALRDEAIGVNSPPSDGWAGPRHHPTRHQRASSEASQRGRGQDFAQHTSQFGAQDVGQASSQGTGSTSLVARLSLRRRTSRKSPPRTGPASPPRPAPQDLLEADEPPSQQPSPSVTQGPRWGRRSFDSLTSQELRDEPPAYSAPFGTTLLEHGGGLPVAHRSERIRAPSMLTGSAQSPALPGSSDLLRRSRTQHRSVTFAGTPPAAAPRRGHNTGAGARQSWASSYDGRVDHDPFGDESLEGFAGQEDDGTLDRTASGRLRPVISSTTRAKPVHEGSTLPATPAYPSGYWAPHSNGPRLASGSSLRADGSSPSSNTGGGSRRASRTSNAAGEGMMDAREYMRVRDELMKSSGPFFAVRRGWKKGVYIRKDEADRQTRGMSEFAAADEALEWLASANAPVPSSTGLIIAGTSSSSSTSLTSLAPPGDAEPAVPRPRSPDSPFGLLAEQASAGATGAAPTLSPTPIARSTPSHSQPEAASSSAEAALPPPPPPKTKIVEWEQFDDSASLMESIASPRASLGPSSGPSIPGSESAEQVAPVSAVVPASIPEQPATAPALSLSSCAALVGVSNLDASIAFYEALLGAVVIDRKASQAKLRVGGADIWLRVGQVGGLGRMPTSSLWTLEGGTAESIAKARDGLVLRLASPAVEGKAGADVGEVEQTPWGTSEFSITDPDGNRLVLST